MLAKVVRKVEFKLYTSLDRLEECPAIPQPFDPIFPATTLGVLLFSFLAGISPVLRVGDQEN
jgi:hypothetical protein